MNLTNLKNSPEYYLNTIKMIEESFGYHPENKFDIDFYPLMSEENRENCHILVIDNKVVAHVGVLKKELIINNKTFSINMYGGIAVAENERGKGYFKKIFHDVLNNYSNCSLHLLWSDQLEMYEKFNFHPTIEQFEYNDQLDDAIGFEKISLSDLTDKDLSILNSIYETQSDLRIKRTTKDWKQLAHITSSDFYIKKSEGNITNYFFMNKGEDLNGVIIEVGSFDDYHEIMNYGVLWSPIAIGTNYETLYAAVAKIGDKSFIDFIQTYTDNIIKINTITADQVDFKFENNDFFINT